MPQYFKNQSPGYESKYPRMIPNCVIALFKLEIQLNKSHFNFLNLRSRYSQASSAVA
jgi:hypothetical protein